MTPGVSWDNRVTIKEPPRPFSSFSLDPEAYGGLPVEVAGSVRCGLVDGGAGGFMN